MNKKVKISSAILLGLTLAITGCNTNAQDNKKCSEAGTNCKSKETRK